MIHWMKTTWRKRYKLCHSLLQWREWYRWFADHELQQQFCELFRLVDSVCGKAISSYDFWYESRETYLCRESVYCPLNYLHEKREQLALSFLLKNCMIGWNWTKESFFPRLWWFFRVPMRPQTAQKIAGHPIQPVYAGHDWSNCYRTSRVWWVFLHTLINSTLTD
jgi:hypothetical protein